MAGDTARIVAEIREEGDAALLPTRRAGRLQADSAAALLVPEDEIAAARTACGAELVGAMEAAEARIAAFHARQIPEPLSYVDAAGVRLGQRWTPLDGGRDLRARRHGVLSELVLMNAVPARIAGVGRIAMAVRRRVAGCRAGAGRRGDRRSERNLADGRRPGHRRARLGTATIRPVDKITGPATLGGGGQAPGVRQGWHRPDRGTVGNPGGR